MIKPIDRFEEGERPEVAVFFARPEVIGGLSFLAAFLTSDIDVVRTPFGPGCSGLVTWPMKYLRQDKQIAVLGAFDPSCRKFLKPDELSFAVPYAMYRQMLERWEETFLKQDAWKTVRKKIARSRNAWGEG